MFLFHQKQHCCSQEKVKRKINFKGWKFILIKAKDICDELWNWALLELWTTSNKCFTLQDIMLNSPEAIKWRQKMSQLCSIWLIYTDKAMHPPYPNYLHSSSFKYFYLSQSCLLEFIFHLVKCCCYLLMQNKTAISLCFWKVLQIRFSRENKGGWKWP